MTKTTFLCMLFLCAITTNAQVEITADPGNGMSKSQPISDNGVFNVEPQLSDLKTFTLQYSKLISGHSLVVEAAGAKVLTPKPNVYKDGTSAVAYTFDANILNKEITIKETDGKIKPQKLLSFRFIQTIAKPNPSVKKDETDDTAPSSKLDPLSTIIATQIEPNYKSTPMGFISNDPKDDMTHIFLNEFGNNILGTIPQGISNRQYKVHIFYRENSKNPDQVDYSIKQKSGSFSSSLSYNNTGLLNSLADRFHGEEEKNFDTWKEKTFILGIATDDLTFDVLATTVEDGKPVYGILQTYTITMAPVYHGSFDVGLVNSTLNNADFSLVQSPDNPAETVVKETNKTPKGMVTLMATIYTSPVILLEKLFQKKTRKRIPAYKLSGRNFLDDHRFFERIYPTIGVSISDKAFENLFFGLHWEITRGLGIFGGGHWGKVNVFDMPNYQPGMPVTQSQFDYFTNTTWKVNWAYGAKVDILIITNIFK